MGGYLYPSVLRSPGVTPQKCRAAHGPRHPAVTTPLRLYLIGEWSFVRCFRDNCLVFCVVVLVLGVETLFGLVPFRTCPRVRFGVCCPLFLLFCYGDVRRRRFSLCLSLSLSLSGAGETQTPFGVWVSPCDSSSWTRSAMTTRSSCSAPLTRSGSRTCFFFFFLSSSSFAGLVVVGLGLLVFCLAGWFLLAVSFFCGGALLCALRARCCLGRFRRGRETRHLPPHFLIAIMIVFRGLRVGTDIPCVAQRGSTPIRSHPPHPLPAEHCKGQSRKGVGDTYRPATVLSHNVGR